MSVFEFILKFSEDHPFLAFFVILVVGQICSLPFRLINRVIRHKNIKLHGWPPPYLDADGDLKEDETK